jgi:hypothetical protein
VVPINLQIQNAQVCASALSSGPQTCNQIVYNPTSSTYAPVNVNLASPTPTVTSTPTSTTSSQASPTTTSPSTTTSTNPTTASPPTTDSSPNTPSGGAPFSGGTRSSGSSSGRVTATVAAALAE